mmetsp:Transcript_494/g.772  ORF Transcript_494/g.772 Transcript_494/m.772 type:complete len:149 (+) Transcript_494:19-465(+)
MFLVSLDVGGRVHMPFIPYMRWGSHISILAVLVCLFVIPHDPSSRIPSNRVGSDAMLVQRHLPGWHAAPSPVVSRQAVASSLPSTVQVPTPDTSSSEVMTARRLRQRLSVLRWMPRARGPALAIDSAAPPPISPPHERCGQARAPCRH